MHAKVAPETPLGEAHELTDRLEVELRREIDRLARVEVHLEPRDEPNLRGTVISAEQGELTASVRRIAESYPPIVRCHEVAVSLTGDVLYLVLHCEAEPACSISDIHDASLRIEAEVHRMHPDVRSVTVHFEPTRPRPD